MRLGRIARRIFAVFHTFDELFFKKQSDALDVNEIDFEDMMLNDHIIDYKENENNPTLKVQLEYVTGYLFRKSRKTIKNCKNSEETLFEKNEKENTYISCREYIQKGNFCHTLTQT